MQRVQLDLASETYRAELARETGYASKTTSERGFAFLLDLANQFGPGRVEQHYKRAAQPGVGEAAILKSMEDAFTAIAKLQYQPQVRARREFFRTTALLSDQARLYRTGESFPNIARRTILIGGNPCFRNVSWNSSRL